MRRYSAWLRIIGVALCILLFCIFLPLSGAAEKIQPPSMEEAKAVWFSHLESETLVASKNENENVGAGTAVKVMAGLLFCEQLANQWENSLLLEGDVWTLSSPYFAGHRLELSNGDIINLKDLLYAAICGSYNDAFYILAVHTDGSLEGFVERMNTRAKEIGMKNTRFEDPTGLIDGSRTTAADIALLAKVAYQNELYMQLCNTVSYSFSTLKKQDVECDNRNALICQYDETKYFQKHCNGMSAGSTSADGNCVITVAKHENETYICVVLGAQETDAEQFGYRIVNRLVDWVYQTYSYVEIISPDVEICRIPVTVSDRTTEVPVKTDETHFAYLPAHAELGKDITYSIRLINTELEAPFEENTFVGYAAIIYEGRVLQTVRLYTVEGAERSTLISGLKSIQSWFENRAVLAGLAFFVLAITAWLVTESILQRRRRHRWDKYFSEKMEAVDVLEPTAFQRRKK